MKNQKKKNSFYILAMSPSVLIVVADVGTSLDGVVGDAVCNDEQVIRRLE